MGNYRDEMGAKNHHFPEFRPSESVSFVLTRTRVAPEKDAFLNADADAWMKLALSCTCPATAGLSARALHSKMNYTVRSEVKDAPRQHYSQCACCTLFTQRCRAGLSSVQDARPCLGDLWCVVFAMSYF